MNINIPEVFNSTLFFSLFTILSLFFFFSFILAVIVITFCIAEPTLGLFFTFSEGMVRSHHVDSESKKEKFSIISLVKTYCPHSLQS